jgi:elongation factor Ts
MMDCKKALVASEGDLELAIEQLRKDGALKAAKKAGRTTAEGLLGLRVADDGSSAVLVEVNIETDFAARNERFIAWVQRVADQAFEAGTDDVAALMAAGLESEREALVQEIGENISVRRIARVTGARVAAYVHADNRKGALVGLSAGDEALGKDLAMHAVALNPKVATPEALDPADIAKEREIYEAQAAESGKPAEIVAKMVEGRVNKYKAEVSMTEQPFVKDGNVKVKDLLKDAGATLETMIRFEVGEGIEKEETDFAAEVAAQVRGEA